MRLPCVGYGLAFLTSHLEAGYCVITVDRGRATLVPASAAPSPLAHEAARLLEHLRFDDVTVVGHPMDTPGGVGSRRRGPTEHAP